MNTISENINAYHRQQYDDEILYKEYNDKYWRDHNTVWSLHIVRAIQRQPRYKAFVTTLTFS